VGVDLKESASAGGGYAKELSEDDKLRQREMLVAHCATVDVVITTALIRRGLRPQAHHRSDGPGHESPAPSSWTWARDGGGNCELSEALVGRDRGCHGVKIIRATTCPARMPAHASAALLSAQRA